MKFYRVHLWSEVDSSLGFEWHTTKRAAERCAGRFRRSSDVALAEVDVVDVVPTRAGILAALARYAVHPDNG